MSDKNCSFALKSSLDNPLEEVTPHVSINGTQGVIQQVHLSGRDVRTLSSYAGVRMPSYDSIGLGLSPSPGSWHTAQPTTYP